LCVCTRGSPQISAIVLMAFFHVLNASSLIMRLVAFGTDLSAAYLDITYLPLARKARLSLMAGRFSLGLCVSPQRSACEDLAAASGLKRTAAAWRILPSAYFCLQNESFSVALRQRLGETARRRPAGCASSARLRRWRWRFCGGRGYLARSDISVLLSGVVVAVCTPRHCAYPWPRRVGLRGRGAAEQRGRYGHSRLGRGGRPVAGMQCAYLCVPSMPWWSAPFCWQRYEHCALPLRSSLFTTIPPATTRIEYELVRSGRTLVDAINSRTGDGTAWAFALCCCFRLDGLLTG